MPKTNLYLVVVDGRCPLSGQNSFNGVPGAPEEDILFYKKRLLVVSSVASRTILGCFANIFVFFNSISEEMNSDNFKFVYMLCKLSDWLPTVSVLIVQDEEMPEIPRDLRVRV